MRIPGATTICRHVSGNRYTHKPVVGSDPQLTAVVRQECGDLQVWRSACGEPLAQWLSLDTTLRQIEAIESSLCPQPKVSLGVLRDRKNGIAAERRRVTGIAAKAPRRSVCPVNDHQAVVACCDAQASRSEE